MSIISRRGLVTALGGGPGPPASHMVVAACSRLILGPWAHCPHNPVSSAGSGEVRARDCVYRGLPA